uniref:RRM domain-containing protein n=1 Tax=Zea mays TaxID=4577 RepID=A0A804LI51_MAIZE
MAASAAAPALLRRLFCSSIPASSSVLRATFCSSAGFGSSSPSSIFGDATEVANVPPLTTPNLFVSGLSRLTTDEKLQGAFAPFGRLLEVCFCVTVCSKSGDG